MPIALNRLKDLLLYTPKTGVFTWRNARGKVRAGDVAGAVDYYGYVVIRIDRVLYKAHRLAWLYMYGEWPSRNIDHINRVKNDNRIENLRNVNQSVNTHNAKVRSNSKSGVSGVVWRADRKKWCARIKIGYKNIFIGNFDLKEDAVKARRNAEKKLLDKLDI
jgi:hypothetical protein